MTETKRKSLPSEICCKNNLKIQESMILLCDKFEISIFLKIHSEKLFKNRFDSNADWFIIQYFFLSSAIRLTSKMKYLTQLVIYAGIFLSGFFPQQEGSFATPSVSNHGTCFIQCCSTQPLAAIENPVTLNLISAPTDQVNQQNDTEILVLKHSFRGRIKNTHGYLSGKSVNLFLVGNTSLSLFKVFRC